MHFGIGRERRAHDGRAGVERQPRGLFGTDAQRPVGGTERRVAALQLDPGPDVVTSGDGMHHQEREDENCRTRQGVTTM